MDSSGALRRSWWIMVVLAAAGGLVGVLLPVGQRSGPSSASSALAWQARTLVGTAPVGGGNQVAGDVTAAQIQFYGSGLVVEAAAAKAAGVHVSARRYPSYFSAVVGPGGPGQVGGAGGVTSTVVLTARGRTRAEATSLATDYAAQLGDYLTFLATTSAISAAGGGKVVVGHTGYQVLETASATRIPRSGSTGSSAGTRWWRGAVGLVVGLLIGVGITSLVAVRRRRIDPCLRDAVQVRSAFGLPCVVEIPQADPQATTPEGQILMVDVVRNPGSAGAEAYRRLRASLLSEPALVPPAFERDHADRDGGARSAATTNGSHPSGASDASAAVDSSRTAPPAGTRGPTRPTTLTERRATTSPAPATPALPGSRQVILVVSAGNELTRPHVAANLAAIYGEAGQNVVVVSTWEIEAAAVAATGSDEPDGDQIGSRQVDAALEPSRLDHVYRLSLRPFMAGSPQLTTRGRALLDAARGVCDVVIVDVAPVLALPHAEALSPSADVVVVVGECGFTTVEDARATGGLLRRIGAPVLGVVLTNAPPSAEDVIAKASPHHLSAIPDPARLGGEATDGSAAGPPSGPISTEVSPSSPTPP